MPALPSDEDWADGSVCGLRARGGYTADITSRNFKVTQFRLTALYNSAVFVTANGITREYTLKKGKPIIVNPSCD